MKIQWLRLISSVPELGAYEEDDLDDLIDQYFSFDDVDQAARDELFVWLKELELGKVYGFGKDQIVKVERQEIPTILLDHIQELCEGKMVARDISTEGNPWYDAHRKVAHIYKGIHTVEQYWESLHEIGHCLLEHGKKNSWDDAVRSEIEAWDYVKNNSKVVIPSYVIAKWEKDRIKGSWEQT